VLRTALDSDAEDEAKSGIDGPQLVESEVAHAVSESARVDGAGLLGEHESLLAVDLDPGPEGCRPR
jgi:hypothetical protein